MSDHSVNPAERRVREPDRPWDTPWKIRTELARLLLAPLARLALGMSGIRHGGGVKLYGIPILQRHRRSSILVGRHMTLRSWPRSNPLAPNHPVVLSTRRAGARLIIGDDFRMTGGTICADTLIHIGNRVTVGANSVVMDTDFHPLTPDGRLLRPNVGASEPTVIEDDVFIGSSCLVLKGVRLGKGCVIAAGSVVAHSIPPGVVAGGVPARPLGSSPDVPAGGGGG